MSTFDTLIKKTFNGKIPRVNKKYESFKNMKVNDKSTAAVINLFTSKNILYLSSVS